MDTHIKIGKSILDKYADYAETEVIDDDPNISPRLK
jgi:hypothetical protein